ncbi:arginase [Fusarium coicis]|nr:arginase [Fusarium coicis]
MPLTSITIIIAPYHVGLYDHPVGGAPVSFINIAPVDEFEGEIGRTFEILRRVSNAVSKAVSNNSFPLVLSGNCYASTATMAGLNQARPASSTAKTGVLWLDAHDDLDTPSIHKNGYLDAMAASMMTGTSWHTLMKTVPGHQPVDVKRMIYCGLRDVSEIQRKTVKHVRFDAIWGDAKNKVGFTSALAETLDKRVGTRKDLADKVRFLLVHSKHSNGSMKRIVLSLKQGAADLGIDIGEPWRHRAERFTKSWTLEQIRGFGSEKLLNDGNNLYRALHHELIPMLIALLPKLSHIIYKYTSVFSMFEHTALGALGVTVFSKIKVHGATGPRLEPMWHQDVFGTAYAAKVTMNNATNTIIRIITGVIQDVDDGSYDRVTIVYVFLATASTVISLAMLLGTFWAPDLRILQFSRKQRILRGDLINERKEKSQGPTGKKARMISKVCFVALFVYVLGSWAAWIWGAATGHN